MIRAIIRFSAQNRVLVLLATAVAVAYGVYTAPATSRWTRSPTSPTPR